MIIILVKRRVLLVATAAAVVAMGLALLFTDNWRAYIGGVENVCPVDDWGVEVVATTSGDENRKAVGHRIWAALDCIPEGMTLSVQGEPVVSDHKLGSRTITAAVAPDFPIDQFGCLHLTLLDLNTGREQSIGYFQGGSSVARECKPSAIKEDVTKSSISPPVVIAHAGGGYRHKSYRNSLDALNHNYALGHRFFELDFNWTRDDHLVAIHNWKEVYTSYFSLANEAEAPTLQAFENMLIDAVETTVTVSRLHQWLISHPDAYVVTDIKWRNLDGLTYLKQQLGENYRQIIPQIYSMEHYPSVLSLGYREVIYTLYRAEKPTKALLQEIDGKKLFAVTVHPGKKDFRTLLSSLKRADIFVYIHTVNAVELYDFYRSLGVDGIYSSYLYSDSQGILHKQ